MKLRNMVTITELRHTFPSLANFFAFSSHVSPACQASLQLLQKSDVQVGQCTLCGEHRSAGHSLHTVSQPARGHQVLFASKSTSVTK